MTLIIVCLRGYFNRDLIAVEPTRKNWQVKKCMRVFLTFENDTMLARLIVICSLFFMQTLLLFIILKARERDNRAANLLRNGGKQ